MCGVGANTEQFLSLRTAPVYTEDLNVSVISNIDVISIQQTCTAHPYWGHITHEWILLFLQYNEEINTFSDLWLVNKMIFSHLNIPEMFDFDNLLFYLERFNLFTWWILLSSNGIFRMFDQLVKNEFIFTFRIVCLMIYPSLFSLKRILFKFVLTMITTKTNLFFTSFCVLNIFFRLFLYSNFYEQCVIFIRCYCLLLQFKKEINQL
jgi:hypothetical protein